MTQLDVMYRYGVPPGERVMLALSKVCDVYGVRKLEFDEAAKTVRVEYDASRLTGAIIHQLLRRAGLAAIRNCQRKPSLIAETIEHVATRIRSCGPVIFALVQKRSGLLCLFQVARERDSIFPRHNFVRHIA